MLSKVDDTGVNINWVNLFSKSHSETKSLPAKAMIWETLYTIEEGTTILNGSIYGYRNDSEWDLKFRILNWSTEVYTVNITSGGTYENTVTFSDKQVSTWYLVQVGFKSNNNTYTRSVEFRYNVNLTWNGNIYKAYNYKVKPRSNTVKAIGNKESATLFWVHSDNTRYTGEDE